MKIINIGAHKTGTTSLNRVMQSLKFKCISEDAWYKNDLLQEEVKRNNCFQGIVDLIKQPDFEYYQDSPYNFNEIYKYLHKNIKDLKFILTIRECEQWFDSFLRWAKKMPYVNSDKSAALYAYGARIIEENRKMIIDRYNKRNDEIIRYFRDTDQLSVIAVDDSSEIKWMKLSEFLGIKNLPKVEWFHLNKTQPQ